MGFIYCLSNPSYGHNIFKIGFTERTPFERMDELYTTGLLFPFKLEFAKEMEFSHKVETEIHHILYDFRILKSREFFHISIELIKRIFDKFEGEYFVFKPNECISRHKVEPYFIEDNDGWLEKTKPKPVVNLITDMLRNK